MFDWLFGRKAPPDLPFDDRVWIDEPARLRAILREATAGPALVVTVFEASEEAVATALGQAELPFVRVGFGVTTWRGPLVLVRADRLRNLSGPVSGDARVIVYEHPPLPADGRALREALAALTPTKPVFHSAPTSP